MDTPDCRPTLDEALQRREVYLRRGIPPEVLGGAMAQARATRTRLFRDLTINFGRRVRRGLRRLGSGADRLHLSLR
jgi:hypothetical protein